MKIDEFYEGIDFPQEAKESAQILFQKENLYQELNNEWQAKREQFYIHAEMLAPNIPLSFYIRKALEVYEEYKKRGISDQIYLDTFHDITLWCIDFHKKHGRYGVSELRWLSESADMKVFRLGRLQYQPYIFEKDISVGDIRLSGQTEALNIHIPEGPSLTPESCDQSFREAIQFFGPSYKYGTCYSWLLSPKLKEILPESSNILRFQARFAVYDIIYPYPQAEERVFGCIQADKTRYPEHTSLQKKLKSQILAGVDIGIGCGIYTFTTGSQISL